MEINSFFIKQDMIVGENIKKLRIDKKLKSKDLANAIGVDASQFAKIESGKIKPTLQQLMDLSSIFKVPVDYFLYGEMNRFGTNESSEILKLLVETQKKAIKLLEDDLEIERAKNKSREPKPQAKSRLVQDELIHKS